MILQGLLSKQEISSAIELPPSMLGLMSIDDSSYVYCTVVSINKSNDATIYISKFDPNHWGDIWRCEFDFYDKIGIFERFCTLMHDNKIPILSSETSTSDVSGYHTISALLDFHYYFDSITRASRDRIEMRSALASDIETLLLIEFIDELHLRDDNLPRLRLRRVEEYRRIFQKIKAGETPFPTRVKIANGQLLIEGINRLDAELFNNMSKKPFFVLPIADSKDRLLRVHLHGVDRNLFHIKFVLRDEGSAIRGLFHVIRRDGWNCEHIKLHKGHYGSLIADADIASDRFITIDVILRYGGGTKIDKIEDLLANIKADEQLAGAGIRLKEYMK